MRKTLLLAAATLSAVVFLAQCSKDNSNAEFSTNFYTTQAEGKLTLFINDVYQGELAYIAATPQCGATYTDAASRSTST
jgi:hypothetical protein